MGVFRVQVVERARRRRLAEFVVPNVLAYEGMRYVYRQMFPAYEAALTFQIGVSDPLAHARGQRPNPDSGGVGFGPEMTFAACTGPGANEGGGYTAAMRASFGYERKTVAFTAALEADGGALATPVVEFPNEHEWVPQDGDDWDLPWTDEKDQPPPEWIGRRSWEPVVGFPWQRPRKRSATDVNPSDPNEVVGSYMYEWDTSGDLDWLHDLRKMGGFPITMAFLADSARSKLVAAALFRGPVLLRPGLALHVAYQARIFGRITRDFALRFAKVAFQQTGARYDSIHARPLLATAPAFTRRQTYAELEPHFHTALPALELPAWTYVPYSVGPPEVLPRMESTTVPEWLNDSGAPVGPIGSLAVYGMVGGTPELMWVTTIETPAAVPAGDTLRVPHKIRFRLEGV
jgi:hypothetical protein